MYIHFRPTEGNITCFVVYYIDFCLRTFIPSHIYVFSFKPQGLLPTIQDLLPGVDQIFYVRHLYANFRKNFPGKSLKRLMWKVVGCTHPEAWE